MKGQKQGQTSSLKDAVDRLGWRLPDVVAAVNDVSIQLGEGPTNLTENHIGKWIRGDRNMSVRYAALFCLVFDADPPALGLAPRPKLLAAIRDGKIKVAKRRQFEVRTGLLTHALGDGTALNWGRLDHLVPQREPRVMDDLDRISTDYANQLDTVSPTNLMPLVHQLLAKETELRDHGLTRRLAEVTANTAIIAGWLSYNIHNRGDALTFWTRAKELAEDADSAQLRAYALGCLSSLFSGVPKRGEAWQDTSLPISMLDQAIAIGSRTASPSLRAWLFSRRAEEYAAIGNRTLSYQDINRAYSALSRRVPAGPDTQVPILLPWREARLTRYHGSAAQLLNDHRDAVQVLTDTLNRLDHSFLPQRAMATTDLATVLAKKPNPEPERAAALLRDAIELAELGGLTEARMRVMDARRYLQQWRDETFVQALDERLRML